MERRSNEEFFFSFPKLEPRVISTTGSSVHWCTVAFFFPPLWAIGRMLALGSFVCIPLAIAGAGGWLFFFFFFLGLLACIIQA